ncbi:terpenoid synthase [Rickenella mellea]|uniref:Terpene synthase n=1 Tax=Rickenella mellea TaxID=50990 RepID=A0A4Y7PZ76_9AGAM|nr:terpenoid synthase [Rickenella mellea]
MSLPLLYQFVDWCKTKIISPQTQDKELPVADRLRNLPSEFTLRDLVGITERAFELKTSPYQKNADDAARQWFRSFNVYDGANLSKFLDLGKFDLFAALSFPNASQSHLETCLIFFLWAFSTDDLSDEGELQSKPEDVQASVDVSMEILHDPQAPVPDQPYAAMLHSILSRMRTTATPGTVARFSRAFEHWSQSQILQSRNRSIKRMPSVEEFIVMRRATIGGAMVEAMVEYSLDLQLPDYVFIDPIVVAMSEATTDIMTWPNDLCSFNKEQADGDFQNLVFVLMVERDLDLQGAVDTLTQMLSDRVDEYVELKKQLPSFGTEVDAELGKHHKNLEHFVQGTVLWYYLSPRYFRTLDVAERENLIIPIFPREL